MTDLFQTIAQQHREDLTSFLQLCLAIGSVLLLARIAGYILYPSRSAAAPRFRIAGSREVPVRLKPAAQTAPMPRHPHSRAADRVPMGREQHWLRASEPVRSMIANGNLAQDLHTRAVVRLDAAEYSFQRLLEELRPVLRQSQVSHPSDAPLAAPTMAAWAKPLAA